MSTRHRKIKMATWCKPVISTLFLAFMFVAGSANCQERLDPVGLRRISFSDGDRTLALAHQVAFVGLGPMQREAIFLRMNRDGADAEFGCGAHHTNGNFTAIRDENLLYHVIMKIIKPDR